MTAVFGLSTAITHEPVFHIFHSPTTYSQESYSHFILYKVNQGDQQALREIKMHRLASILMGYGSLALNAIPGLKMLWEMAFLMTPLHIAWMVCVTMGIGFVHGFKGTSRQRPMNHVVPN